MFNTGKKEDKDGKGEDSGKELLDAINNMATNFQKGFETLNTSILELRESSDRARPPTSKDDDDDDDDDDDAVLDLSDPNKIENMTNVQLLSAVQKIVQEGLKGVDKSLATAKNEREMNELKAEISKRQREDPLFNHLTPEIAKELKRNPALAGNLDDLYLIAREKNKEKVAEFQKAQEEANKDKVDKKGEKDEKPKDSFGGLSPTSLLDADEEPEKMDTKTAAIKAFDEVFDGVPADLIGG